MNELEKIYKALANRRRLTIIKFLKYKKEASVSEIASNLRLSFRSTSRHLAILRGSDILDKEQKGALAFYSLNQKAHSAIRHLLTLV